jgi:hypothetical protein
MYFISKIYVFSLQNKQKVGDKNFPLVSPFEISIKFWQKSLKITIFAVKKYFLKILGLRQKIVHRIR